MNKTKPMELGDDAYVL